MQDNVDKLQDRLGYIFHNPRWLEQALTHRSRGISHNERLEFLGDGVLNCIIAIILFNQFPDAQEGELTRMRAHLVNEATLVKVAHDLQLAPHLIVGPGEGKEDKLRSSILADAVEALLGAILLDAGMDTVTACVQRWFSPYWDGHEEVLCHKDPKTHLQETLQALREPLPVYSVVQITGEPHQQQFIVHCAVGLIVTEGIGSSRRRAEQQAASKMMEKFLGKK